MSGAVDPAADAQHAPGTGRWWSEAHHLDAATVDGLGLSVRLETYPNLGRAWFRADLVLPGRAGPIVVRDHEVPLPRQGLEIRAEGLWSELWCEAPLDHWTYGLEAFGVALDAPDDALHGEIGERVAVGLDIEWEARGDAHPYGARWPVDGHAQPGVVHGEVLLGRERFDLDASGERRHSWGERAWFDRPAWRAALAGGDRYVAAARTDAAGGGPVFGGYDGHVAVVDGSLGLDPPDGLPVRVELRTAAGPTEAFALEPIATAPVLLTDGPRSVVEQRALCRATPTDRPASGPAPLVGWVTWRTPAPA